MLIEFLKDPKRWRDKLIVTLALLAFVAVLWVLKIPCPVFALTGIPCPGCGMTRALVGAVQFRFAYAFEMHAMFWSAPVLYLYFLCDGRLFRSRWLNRAVLVLIALGFAVNWLRHFI